MNISNYNPYRPLILGADEKVPIENNNYTIGINFDNAATTPPLICVMNDIVNFSPYYSSVHRGDGFKSRLSTLTYEESRDYVRAFINGTSDTEIIYTKNCTESINKLAGIMSAKYKNTIILSTTLEHHSNDLPWRKYFAVKYVDILPDGSLDMNDLKNKLEAYSGQISLVTVTGASNVTGTKPPIYDIAELAHRYGAKILVDGAQLIPHDAFSMNLENPNRSIDFLAFSAHKMYAPFGTGILAGPKAFFENNPPFDVGGGTIRYVSHDEVLWTSSPDKEEAGSPNVIGALACSSAAKKLQLLGMENINKYETSLTMYLTNEIKKLNSVILYGPYENINNKVSIVSFNIEGMHHTTVSKSLSLEFGIAVRSGCFCAHPYIQSLLGVPKEASNSLVLQPKEKQPGMVRISFGLYNTVYEINRLLEALEIIINNKNYYNRKYGS